MIEFTLKDNVEKYVSNNLEVLETSFDKAAQKYIALEKKKKSLDFGQKLTPKILNDLAPIVTAKTMDFLEVKQSTDCYLSMFYLPDQIKRGLKVAAGTFVVAGLATALEGLTIHHLIMAGEIAALFGIGVIILAHENYANSAFDYKDDHLMIGATNTVNAIGSIAHEYTHCLQHKFTHLDIKGESKNNTIVEGHARGLEGIISEKYAQEKDNQAYVYVHSERVAGELKTAYSYMCNKEGITPKKSLEKLPIYLDSFLYNTDIDHYSLGVTAMTIACSKHGEKVYKDVMKSDFEFLRNP